MYDSPPDLKLFSMAESIFKSTHKNSDAVKTTTQYVANSPAEREKRNKENYDRYYQQAKDAGLDDDIANQYAASYGDNPYAYGSTNYRDYEIKKQLAMNDRLKDRLAEQVKRNYDSEAAKFTRLRASGVNPDINGGESLGSASEMAEADASVGNTADFFGEHFAQEQTDRMNNINAVGSIIGTVASAVTGGLNFTSALQALNRNNVQEYMTLSDKVKENGGYLPFFGLQAKEDGSYYEVGSKESNILTKDAALDKIRERIRDLYPHNPFMRRNAERIALDALSAPSMSSKQEIGASNLGSRSEGLRASADIKRMTGLDADPSFGSLSTDLDALHDSEWYESLHPMLNATTDYQLKMAKLDQDYIKKYSEIKSKYMDPETGELKEVGVAELRALEQTYKSTCNVELAAFKVHQLSQLKKTLQYWYDVLSQKPTPFNLPQRIKAQNIIGAYMNGAFTEMSGGLDYRDTVNGMYNIDRILGAVPAISSLMSSGASVAGAIIK